MLMPSELREIMEKSKKKEQKTIFDELVFELKCMKAEREFEKQMKKSAKIGRTGEKIPEILMKNAQYVQKLKMYGYEVINESKFRNDYSNYWAYWTDKHGRLGGLRYSWSESHS